jgi:hypothetical protein
MNWTDNKQNLFKTERKPQLPKIRLSAQGVRGGFMSDLARWRKSRARNKKTLERI